MQALEKTLRNKLERTVMEARDVAEAAARAAVEQLGVGEPKPYAHLSADEKELRRKFRIHGRQLGDFRHPKKDTQEIDRLVEEIAYEHWHRMLFARFLAENNLLMYPDPDDPVAVSLEECEDLATEEGAKNGWELASRFAARMLPQIFRPDSPVFQLELPPEHEQKLERLLAELPLEVFHASDSLGWVYQFWQAKKKDEVNASEVKIGARELPAVTQLFTEPYMVAFLLDNSLGAWWAARRLTESDLKNAKTEGELRQKASLPGVPLEYLRFVKDEDGKWTPAAGTFDGWPERLADLKALDPCCGSGHFLVAAFMMLVPMRMVMEGLSARETVDRVLAENIHGLEIDQRCVELAAFALALTAWRYPEAVGYRQLPELNVACSGLTISAKKEEWLSLAGENTNLRLALEELYKQFKDAPVLGSLINPAASLGKGSLFELQWEDVGPLLTKALSSEQDVEKTEIGVVARGVVKAASILMKKYEWIITNVPYLSRAKQNEKIREYAESYYPKSMYDLATVFLSRIVDLLQRGTASLVLPQSWIYLFRYKNLRKQLLTDVSFNVLTRLGAGAFEGISGEVVKVTLLVINNLKKSSEFLGIDVENQKNKAVCLKTERVKLVDQKVQQNNPDFVISFDLANDQPLLNKFADSWQGLVTSDINRYTANFWETHYNNPNWDRFISSPSMSTHWTGRNLMIRWNGARGPLHEEGKAHNFPPQSALSKYGVLFSQVGTFYSTIYSGEIFNDGSVPVIPIRDKELTAIYSYCTSSNFIDDLRKVSTALRVTNDYFTKVPFDLDHWTKVAEKKYPNGLPKPYSDDPTQWIFHGHPSPHVRIVVTCKKKDTRERNCLG